MTLRDRYNDILNQKYGLVDNLLHLPFLHEKARGNVLEIGVSRGNSTCALLLGVQENGGKVYSVDVDDKCKFNFTEPNWEFIWAHSVAEWDRIVTHIPDKIDVAYIDGDHSYETVKSDLGNVLPLMSPGGIVMVHDVLHPDYPGVMKAFGEAYTRNSGMNAEICEGSWGLGVIYVDRKQVFKSIWGADRGGR